MTEFDTLREWVKSHPEIEMSRFQLTIYVMFYCGTLSIIDDIYTQFGRLPTETTTTEAFDMAECNKFYFISYYRGEEGGD